MDYLRDIKKMEQVYSNDLNEILLKTPPKIFRYALLTFVSCIIVISVIGYTFDYTEKKDFSFVYQEQEGINRVIFFSDQDISKYLESSVVEVLDSHDEKQMSLKIGEFKKESLWNINGKAISENQLNDASFTDISMVSRTYKFILFVKNKSIIKKLNSYKVGKLKIPLDEKKFYELVL